VTRVNERIRAPRVRVLYGDDNQQLGVISTREALDKARSMGLDLVEVAANADPPVCRITDYGKYRYQQSKLKKEKPKSSTRIKEVKFRVRIETNDYNVKLAKAENFLDHGNKLRVQLQFRGREMAHQELGFELMLRVKEDLKSMAHVDVEPRQAGRNITMMLSPLPDGHRKRKFKLPHELTAEELAREEAEEFDDDDDHHHHEGDSLAVPSPSPDAKLPEGDKQRVS
jgi:translation initiation factor IF-3